MYCSQCGKQLMENSKFCSYCGAKVGDVAQEIQEIYNLHPTISFQEDNVAKKKLLKEVLGYNDDEIKILEEEHFKRNIANNLTIEQAKLITEIFRDNGLNLYLSKGERPYELVYWQTDLGIFIQDNPPKEHYCDTPLIPRNKLADFSLPNDFEYAEMERRAGAMSISRVECPYCHSTNVHKLDNRHMDIIGGNLIGGNLAQLGKNFHCNKCGADF